MEREKTKSDGDTSGRRSHLHKQYLVRFLVCQPEKRDVTRRATIKAASATDARLKMGERLKELFPNAERIVIYER